MNRVLACLLLASGLVPATAVAQSRECLVDAARAFDESALRAGDDNARPMPMRKWRTPVRLTFSNPSAAPNLVDLSRKGVRTIAAQSVLSYVQHGQRSLTPLDQHLIHTLYDPRLQPGMAPAPASQLACRILGERLGAAAADIDAVCRDRKGPTPST